MNIFYQKAFPHSEQNLGAVPASGTKPHLAHFSSSGLAVPHSGQNLPVLLLPQVHFQLASSAGCSVCWF